ncbi:MAG: hypothetical protein WCC63_03705 [Candidatus Bathyarchaeia archaeon]
MAVAREKLVPAAPPQRMPLENRPLNAQQVTSMAIIFLKSLGHRRGIKPKRVFIENQRYVVESDVGKKLLAKVQIDVDTSEIKEYSIEKKTEEAPMTLPVEPRAILMMLGLSVAVSIIFSFLNLQSLLSGLL